MTNQLSNLDIHQINIMVMGDPSKEPVPFTLNMLYHPSLQKSANLSSLPYITHKMKYPYKILYQMNYSKMIQFFFNKQTFKSVLNKYGNAQEDDTEIEEESKAEESNAKQPKENKEEKEKKMDQILTYNVQLMIKLLFPTEWPSKNNSATSFNEYIQQKLPDISFKNVFNKDIVTPTFSYLQLNGKKYTIVKSIWLNDIYNHPVYFDFMEQYNKFTEWKQHVKEDKTIENKINKNMKMLNELYTKEKNNKSIQKNLDEFLSTQRTYYKSLSSTQTQTMGSVNELIRVKEKENLNNLIELFEKFIAEMKNEPKNIRELYKFITDINTIIKEIDNHKEIRIVINSSITSAIQLLTKNISEIYNLNEILEEYIKVDTIPSLKNEQQSVIDLLKTDYPQYITFTEKIQKLIPNKSKSSNRNLQNLIESQNYLLLKELYEGKISNSNINEYNTGVTLIHLEQENEVKYEIYVSFDLIEGEYDANTIDEFKCKFQGFYLGSNFEYLFNRQYKNMDYRSNKFFLTKDELKEFDAKKLKKKGGYKTKSRKTKKNIKKTRKAY